MSGPSPGGPDPLRSVIRSQHPDIGREIQGAIETLRKFQQIAGDDLPLLPGSPRAASAAGATIDSDGGAPDDFSAHGVPTLEASSSFGRYQIVRQLGQGAMGAVYLAYDAELQRHVALKTPFLGGNPQILSRFYREARATAQVRSPYVCPIYDVGSIGGVPYLSMAFIEGHTLTRAITEGQFRTEREVAAVVRKIALGLQKAHDHDIIHRDLKPDNVMIDPDGEPVVMDFGLARKVEEDVRITTPGRIVGTPAYMSPEQVDGDPARIGAATDVYSLGVVLYQMLAGDLPFRGSLTSVLKQIAGSEPAPPSSRREGLAPGSALELLCMRMLAKSPEGRDGPMAAVAAQLERIANPPPPAPVARPPLWRRLCSKLFGRGSAVPVPAQEARAVPESLPLAAPAGPDFAEQTADFDTPPPPTAGESDLDLTKETTDLPGAALTPDAALHEVP